MSEKILLSPGKLCLQDIKKNSSKTHEYVLDPECIDLIYQAQNQINNIIKENKTVYGINTGFGSLAHQIIPTSQLNQLQEKIILSHAAGVGEPLEDDITALILLLKINSLAQGYSGARLELIQALLTFYNQQLYPCIPSKGSVGASGDLAPLAHMALPLLGVGNMRYQRELISAQQGLALAKMQPFKLGPKEGLALLNGLQVSTALIVKALFLTQHLFYHAIAAGSLSVDAAKGSDIPFDDRIHAVRKQPAQRYVASLYRALLQGSAIRDSHRECSRVQDPYSLRCQPQIMGAIWHQIQFVEQTLEAEINAVTDNPLVFAQDQTILSGGNFHGEILAMAADNLALAIAEIGASSERRIALLIDKGFSGLPAFLVQESGLNSGFMIAHVTAASCASDNKALAHPHSVDSLPTSANQEDHVSMATNAASRLFRMIDNTAVIVAIELLAAAQGLEFHRPLLTSPPLEQLYQKIRSLVPKYEEDRYFAPDINRIQSCILQGSLVEEAWYESP